MSEKKLTEKTIGNFKLGNIPDQINKHSKFIYQAKQLEREPSERSSWDITH